MNTLLLRFYGLDCFYNKYMLAYYINTGDGYPSEMSYMEPCPNKTWNLVILGNVKCESWNGDFYFCDLSTLRNGQHINFCGNDILQQGCLQLELRKYIQCFHGILQDRARMDLHWAFYEISLLCWRIWTEKYIQSRCIYLWNEEPARFIWYATRRWHRSYQLSIFQGCFQLVLVSK
jgi:hypothetical protein